MEIRHKAFTEALESFSCLTEAGYGALASQQDKRLIDPLENGKAQKSDYALELFWTAIKVALKGQEGIDDASLWYQAGHLSEEDYLAIIAAIDDRNKHSNIYNAEEFMVIVAGLNTPS